MTWGKEERSRFEKHGAAWKTNLLHSDSSEIQQNSEKVYNSWLQGKRQKLFLTFLFHFKLQNIISEIGLMVKLWNSKHVTLD